ncbi:unnamed protein product [Schistosoma turkestanicum]|nr:unnamed protein product [Schistosoma turkestanicum]
MISYLQDAKDTDDAKHSSYIQEINKVLKRHKGVIDEVNAAESRIRNYGLSVDLFHNSDCESSRSGGPSSLLSPIEVDDSFLGDLGLLTKEDIYFNGKPRSHDFSTIKSSTNDENIENVNKTSTIKPVINSKGKKLNQLKYLKSKKYSKHDDVTTSDTNLVPPTRSLIPFGKTAKENRFLFQAEPETITFKTYLTGNIYEAIVKIRNISNTSRSIRVLPPKTTHFSIKEGKFPLQGSSIISPGMAAVFLVQFSPDNVGDFEDELTVKCENQLEPLCVKLLGKKSRPQLNILECYDLGYTLKGGSKISTIQLKNSNAEIASNSKFLFITQETFNDCQQFDANNFTKYYSLHENSTSTSLCLESFSLKPFMFNLESLKSVTITVEFEPLYAAEYKWELVLICDNGQFFPVTFIGRGEEPQLQIVDIIDQNHLSTCNESSPSFRKINTISNDQFYFYEFPKHHPHTISPKTMTIRNCCSEPLRFQWIQEDESSDRDVSEYTSDSLIKSDDLLNQRKSLSTSVLSASDERDNNAVPLLFTINPTTGVFEANETKKFQICFNPTQVGTFETQLSIILLGIPQVDEQGNCYTLDKKHLTVELQGTAEPVSISIEPPTLIIPGKCLLDVPLYRTVQLINNSNCSVAFSWQNDFDVEINSGYLSDCTQSTAEILQSSGPHSSRRYSEIEKSNDGLIILEPIMGVIAPGQSMNIDIIVSSSKSIVIKENIPCFINILPNSPLWFYIEAEFSAPAIVFDRTDCNFGLMRPNETAEMNILLTNTTTSLRKWFIKMETFFDKFASEMKIKPSNGIAKPLESVTVTLSFTPQVTRSVREVLTVHTEDSEEIRKLLILAEVQTPLIDFYPVRINYSQCFWNVPITETLTLTNLNMLECDLEWLEPIGCDKEFVTVNINPKTYRIKGRQSQPFEVSICAHKQISIDDLQIPLRVNGLNELLYLSIAAKVQGLSINYLLIDKDIDPVRQECSQENVHIPKENSNKTSLILDFGQNVGLFEPVEKWIEFRNNTPIPTRICVDTGKLSTKASYADYGNFPHKPKLGAVKYLLLVSEQSTENYLSRQRVLHEKNDHKTRIRILYDWCNLLLKHSKGACVLAHSAISSSTCITDFQIAELQPITASQYFTTTSTIPSWHLPAYGSLRICFICIANLWGAYEDTIHIYVLPEFDLTSKSNQPPIVLSTSFKVVGCPIYSLAAGHFGELSNRAIVTSDVKNNFLFPKTALPLKATRQFIRFGSSLFNGPIVKRQIRLHNSSEAAIRIDWQVFLDSEMEDHDQLLSLLCFISEPFTNLSSNRTDNETSLTIEHSTSNEISEEDSTRRQLINLVLRPYDGKLLWESQSAQIISSTKKDFSELFVVYPVQLIIPPHEEATVTVLMNPTEAYLDMRCYETFDLKAHVIGYLTTDSKDFLDFPRTHALITEQLRFDITAKLEQPRIIIDLNNDSLEIASTSPNLSPPPKILHFKSGLGKFLVDSWQKKSEANTLSIPQDYLCRNNRSDHVSQRSLIQKAVPLTNLNEINPLLTNSIVLLRSIQLRCPNNIPVTIYMKANQTKNLGFQIRKDKPYAGNENNGIIMDTGEDSNLTTMIQMTRKAFEQLYKPQIMLTLNPGKLEMVDDSNLILKNEILFQFNGSNEDYLQRNSNDSIVNNTDDILKLETQVTITRPKFTLYPVDLLDFGTVLIGQTKRMEIKIQNLTQTPTFWLLKHGEKNNNQSKIDNNEDRIFNANKISGFLDSFSNNNDGYFDLITVEFKPRRSIQCETTWTFEGILGEEAKLIKLTGIGTFDESYHTLY